MNDQASAVLGSSSGRGEAGGARPSGRSSERPHEKDQPVLPRTGTAATSRQGPVRADPLSDVLRVVRLDGAFFYAVEASAPWSVEAVAAKEILPRILPGAEHLISYHILTAGRCWGGLIEEPPVALEPGDVLVFPHGDPHRMSSAPALRMGSTADGATPARYPETVTLGDGGRVTATFVCGFLGCDRRPFNPLLSTLPRRLHLRGLSNGWLQSFAHQVPVYETGRIINLLDWRALRPGADHLPYTISKAGLVALTRSLAQALAPRISVNGLALGAILPPESGPAPGNILERVPAGRWADLHEVGQAAVFLLDGPSYITGEIIHIDGGRHLV